MISISTYSGNNNFNICHLLCSKIKNLINPKESFTDLRELALEKLTIKLDERVNRIREGLEKCPSYIQASQLKGIHFELIMYIYDKVKKGDQENAKEGLKYELKKLIPDSGASRFRNEIRRRMKRFLT